MKLFNALAIALLTICSPSALAMQLPCGEYEVVGEYDDASSTITLSPGSNGALPLFLTGAKTIDSFLPGPGNFYRVKINIRRQVGDAGGMATLLGVQGMELPTGSKFPIVRSKPHACL
ncbi:MAG: hypothetical protein EOP11_13700 [Proteobacteria bacterium]|nr:MAG: hypothetical protein EOP11_13700 [Pseudomonadota bacterium]